MTNAKKPMTSSLVVLTLNEVEGIKKVMPRVKREWVDEIVVVDGGSIDGTQEEATKAGLKVVTQERRGRGEAFRVGLRNTRGDIIVYFSPDGNEEPQDIPHLVQLIKQGYDMAIASRFGPGSKSYDATLIRRFGNRMFTTAINLLFGCRVTDAVNGFRAVTRKCMEDLDTTAQTFEIEIQMTMRAARLGYKIAEIPSVEGYRIGGRAKLNTVVDGWKYTVMLAKEAMRRNYRPSQ